MKAREKLALAGEIVVAYVLARWSLRRTNLRATLSVLREPPSRGPRNRSAEPEHLSRAVVRTLTVLPADSRCLMRSLVLTRLLARRGHASQMVIAVRPGERFAAHSWIEHEGRHLLPAEAPSFERLVTL